MARKNKTIRREVDVRIQKTDSGKWCVMKSCNKNPSFVSTTQKEAISYGRDAAKKIGAVMIIHNENGDERRRYYSNSK